MHRLVLNFTFDGHLMILLTPWPFHFQPKRDGKDYDSISGVTHMLNNADTVLKRDDVKEAIEDYEDLFAGARNKVREGWQHILFS